MFRGLGSGWFIVGAVGAIAVVVAFVVGARFVIVAFVVVAHFVIVVVALTAFIVRLGFALVGIGCWVHGGRNHGLAFWMGPQGS